MFRIADLSIGNASIDCCYEYEFEGQKFEVQRFGTNFSSRYMRDLIVALHNKVDAFAISHLPPVMRIRGRSYVHRQYLEIMAMPTTIPVCTGAQLKELAVASALMKAVEEGLIRPENGVFFPLGLLHLEAVYALKEEFGRRVGMGDTYSVFGVPLVTKPGQFAATLSRTLLHFANMRELRKQTPKARGFLKRQSQKLLLKQVKDYQYVFSDVGPLVMFGENLDFIKGKDVIITENHHFESLVRDYNPASVINLFPEKFRISPHVNYSVMDATLRLAHRKTAPLSMEEWRELLGLDEISKEYAQRYVLGARPSKQHLAAARLAKKRAMLKKEQPPDFAFIVHPLSRDYLFNSKYFKPLAAVPDSWKRGLEKSVSKAPGFVFGRISGVVSQKTNREISGVVYALLSTPKMMLQIPPEETYAKLERLCHHAGELGAKIIGLGAYTKVIGDSGETVNRHSPIPVTTGNSLSASATLWAVHEVATKMGLLKPLPGSSRLNATATVIGATGSIGKVSAKLLSLAFSRINIVAPRSDRLEELAQEIRKISPDCQVFCSTQSNDFARQTDVLVTATSAYDQKIIDVEMLKPGCIVCDCSRPLDFSQADALKRPDILIVESGEVILPGPVEITCDIGLPGKSVYACLGETAVLAMEGSYEPFTLGRNIEWTKVKHIYRLAREHGVKLAAIHGHNGFISDREIALTRELALSRLGRRP